MLGFVDLAGSEPCPRCGSDSGDCGWIRGDARCSGACSCCGGRGAGRCDYCGEVVPCGAETGRNPRPDALCAWRDLARLHAEDCRWVLTRGGDVAPLPLSVSPV